MMFQLPFLQSSLQRMLLRDFYKKENAQFFSVVSQAATGSTTSSATVDAEQLVDWIANQLNANFNASFALVNYSQWARLLKTKPSDYSVPGGVIIDPAGNIRICGVPVIGASWVTDDKRRGLADRRLQRILHLGGSVGQVQGHGDLDGLQTGDELASGVAHCGGLERVIRAAVDAVEDCFAGFG